jgi:hypothetical protein
MRFFTSFRMTNMASPSLRHSLLRGEGKALHHVGCRTKALNLIWFGGGGDVFLINAFGLNSTYQNNEWIVNEKIYKNFFLCHPCLSLGSSD